MLWAFKCSNESVMQFLDSKHIQLIAVMVIDKTA